MRFIENQPIQFDGDIDNPFVDNIKYKQKIQQDDETQFQFAFESSRYTENVVTNGDFSNGFDDWGAISGFFVGGDDTTGQKWAEVTNAAGTIGQNCLRGGSTYTVSLSVLEIIWGATIKVYFGTVLKKTITTAMGAGVYTFDATPAANGGTVLFKIVVEPFMATTGEPTGRVKIDNVNVVERMGAELNSYFIIYDMDGTYVNHLNVLDNMLTNGGTISTDFQMANGLLTGTIDWSALALPNGCYKIGVVDADINVYSQNFCANGEFNRTGDLQVWELTETGDAVGLIGASLGTLYTNIFKYTSASSGTAKIQQTVAITSGRVYKWRMVINAISNCTVTVNVGGTSTTYTTTGTKSGTVTAANGNFYVSCDRTGVGNASVEIEYFRLQGEIETLVPDYYSNPFSLQTTWDNTVLINAYNSQNAFDMDFENHDFSPRIRVNGYFLPADSPYNIIKSDEELWNGKKTNFYYKRRKRRVLAIVQEPEFVHDFLSLLLGFDHIYVDSKEYFISEDEYTIVWNKFRLLGAVNLLLEEKVQQVRKTRKDEDTGAYYIDATENVLTDPVSWVLTIPTVSYSGRPTPLDLGVPSGDNQYVDNSVENQ